MKMFALFPNLVLTEPRTAADVHFIPQAVHRAAMPRALAVWEVADLHARQAAERQLTVLYSHLSATALLCGQQPAAACCYLTWVQGEKPEDTPPLALPLDFGFLADRLPADLEPTARTVTFLAKYLRERDPAMRAMLLYNAFGTLPGGFEDFAAGLALPEEREIAARLCGHIEAVRACEDDDSGRPHPEVRPLDPELLGAIAQVYLRALLIHYPYLGPQA